MRSSHDYRTPCLDCTAPSWGERCRACRDKTQTCRADDDPHRTRALREQAAPGLSAHQRRALLKVWRRQRRPCAYCLTAPVESVDHVVPLVRGGTSFEGNLAPCCSTCNSSKSGYMLSEWRYGKRLPPRIEPLPWRARRERKAKPKRWAEPQLMFNVCICGELGQGRTEWCSMRCRNRTAYRRRVGIPDDAPLHSQYTRRAS